MPNSLKNKTIFITGSSRGIGYQMAIRFAKDGANIVVTGKTAEPDPRMPGTIYSTAEDIEAAGGRALPIQVDIRNEEELTKAVQTTVDTFGGIDILVNNASALDLSPSILDTPMRRFDMMFGVNVRGAFLASKLCLPHLRKAENPHILIVAPPINTIKAKWFIGYNLAYTISKYGMSLCALGLYQEFAKEHIGINTIWPKFVVETSAVKRKMPEEINRAAIHPRIMADAAYIIVTGDSSKVTGNFYLDADLVVQHGFKLEDYRLNPDVEPAQDFFTD